MIRDFLDKQLNRSRYELIDDGKVYYGEIEGLEGVWATGRTLEECRKNLVETLDGWIVLRLKKNLPIPDFEPSITESMREKVNA